MKSVIETCKPKESIIQGTFNPEVFTAALGPVIDFYHGTSAGIDSIYTDADVFFREATFPTDGLRTTVSNIFRRIAGDMTAPSVQRMETAFGGGKTHTLISCVHIAYRGKDLAGITSDIMDSTYLPEAGSVSVAGIAGDEIDLYKTVGENIHPYTLWGDMALQLGGQELYAQVRADAESYAAPGKSFFEKVFANRKALVMFDELAQYAARLETYKPGQGSNQVASFLMGLLGYARSTPGIAIVVTLAGASNAFAQQTEKLTKTLNAISSTELTRDAAEAITERAIQDANSVISRDATVVTPVQANEIAAVLAKRLFDAVDKSSIDEIVEGYVQMYDKNRASLPEEATSINFQDRLIANYPFHPTLIDFLNNKLAQAETFQGTRGVLRVLAMTIRSLWKDHKQTPLIHVSDIDMRNSNIVNEILGKTGSTDLRQVLNMDIGSVETHTLSGGKSNAELADLRNPHPEGVRLYEDTWKVVFLNSLVARAEGYTSKIFGLTEQEAIFQIATPVMTPSQIHTALEEISNSAFYLRYEKGKYFAHLDPTINSVLARIRSNIDKREIDMKLASVANTMVTEGQIFHVVHSVMGPEYVDDKSEKPVIAVIALDADEININEMYQKTGNGMPRSRQNLLLLLVPKTVHVSGLENTSLFPDTTDYAAAKQHAIDTAKQVIAMKKLADAPEEYAISRQKLQESEFNSRKAERNMALRVSVSDLYNTLYYAGSDGITRRELHSAGADNGAGIVAQIQKILEDDNELIMPRDRFGAALLKTIAKSFFFAKREMLSCKELLENFYRIRTWPILSDKNVLATMIREGVKAGIWVVYQMSHDPTDSKPAQLYSDRNELPMDIELLDSDWKLMSYDGVVKRHWLEEDKPANETIKNIITNILQDSGAATVAKIVYDVQSQLANAEEEQIRENLEDMLRMNDYGMYEGEENQAEQPSMVYTGLNANIQPMEEDSVIISRQAQAERGWFAGNQHNYLHKSGHDCANNVINTLKRIGSMYTRGEATSEVKLLDLIDLKLPGGGTMRVTINNAEAIDFKRLQEFFQDLTNCIRITEATEADVYIDNPDENCALVKKLKE